MNIKEFVNIFTDEVCDNKLSDGRVCYWDDLIPRIRRGYE